MSFISHKKKRLKLDGIFDEPIGKIPAKRRMYGHSYAFSAPRPALSIDEPGSDPIVLRPKEKGGTRRGYNVVRKNVVLTKPAKPKPKRQPRIRPVRGPVLKTRTAPPPRPMPQRKVEKVGREALTYKPSPEEITRATHVVQELRRRRVKASLDMRKEDE